MKKKEAQQNVKQKASEWFGLPEEVLLSLPVIELVGNGRLRIQNYEGVIEYTEESIRLNTHIHMIKISGNELAIVHMGAEEIVIKGDIVALEYIR